MIANRFTQKNVQPRVARRHPMHSGAGLASDLVRRGVANFVKPASIAEETASKPLFAGEQHVLLKSHDGKRYVPLSWAGPKTQVDKRIARGDKPIDETDACAMKHDIAYNNLSKARKAGQITRKQQIASVKKADADFRACASRVKDRPRLGKIASSAIGAKSVVEDLGLLPRSVFSGVEKEDKSGDGPDTKLRKAVARALKQGTTVVQAQPESDTEDEKPQKHGRQIKKVAGLNHQTTPQMGNQFGGNPILLGIAASLLGSLASKAVDKLVERFSGKKQSGSGKASKDDKIKFLLKNVKAQELINAVETIEQ